MADAMAEFNQKVIDEFRSSGGKVGGAFAGAPMIIITHTGAKSGKTHTTPLVYSKDGERYVIVASKAGAPTNPSWYHNLVAHPRVPLEIGTETRIVDAEELHGAACAAAWAVLCAARPSFREYETTMSTRVIPVFRLTG